MLREPVLARRRRDGHAPVRVGIDQSIKQRPGLDLLDVVDVRELETKGRQPPSGPSAPPAAKPPRSLVKFPEALAWAFSKQQNPQFFMLRS